MNSNLSKILKLIGDLTKQELMTINQAVVSVIKTQRDVDFSKASITFKVGDIVSCIDSNGIKTYGVITKKNTKTLQVTTENNYYVNIPATYLTLEEKPSQKLLNFRKEVAPTYKDMYETLQSEIKKGTFH
jgi:hypothetical protein